MVAQCLKSDERDPTMQASVTEWEQAQRKSVSVWVLDETKLRKERGERVKGSEKERDEGFEMQRLWGMRERQILSGEFVGEGKERGGEFEG